MAGQARIAYQAAGPSKDQPGRIGRAGLVPARPARGPGWGQIVPRPGWQAGRQYLVMMVVTGNPNRRWA
jgi:hypothetical protein